MGADVDIEKVLIELENQLDMRARETGQSRQISSQAIFKDNGIFTVRRLQTIKPFYIPMLHKDLN